MHIVFLKFGPNRSQAGQWMAQHNEWIQAGISDGAFLMAGSLEGGLGGAILAAGLTKQALAERIAQDPFVLHQVVVPEIHGIAPSRMDDGFAALLGRGAAGEAATVRRPPAPVAAAGSAP